MFEKNAVTLLSDCLPGCYQLKGPFFKTCQLILQGKTSVTLNSLTNVFLQKPTNQTKKNRAGRGGGGGGGGERSFIDMVFYFVKNDLKAVIHLTK